MTRRRLACLALPALFAAILLPSTRFAAKSMSRSPSSGGRIQVALSAATPTSLSAMVIGRWHEKAGATGTVLDARRVVGASKRFRTAGRRVGRLGAFVVVGRKVPITRGGTRIRASQIKVGDRLAVKGRFAARSKWLRVRRGAVPTFIAKRIQVTSTAGGRAGNPGMSPLPTPPAASSFPSAATTGVPPGTKLTPSGPITVTTAGAVIENLDINGSLLVNAPNVTIRRCRIRSDSWVGVKGNMDTWMEDSEIDGTGSGTDYAVMDVNAVRVNIHDAENGFLPGRGGVLRDSWIHNLKDSGAPHYDGVQIDGGPTNVLIEHNTIDLSEHDQTAAVNINNYAGPVDDVTVRNNRLLGGSYTVYSDGTIGTFPISNVRFIGNRLRSGLYGTRVLRSNATPVVWIGNVDDATGRPLS